MNFEEYFKGLMRQLGIIFIKIMGFTFLIFGIMEQNISVGFIGFLMIDLSPSFIKTTWKHIGTHYHGKVTK